MNTWTILSVIAAISLIRFFFKGRNAVWGGFTMGVIGGLVSAAIFIFVGSNGFQFTIVLKWAVVCTLIGTIFELIPMILGRKGKNMFGIKNRIWINQFRRAVSIENILKLGIFTFEQDRIENDFPDKTARELNLQLAATSINYIFGSELTRTATNKIFELGGHTDDIHQRIKMILSSDIIVEKIIARNLYETTSLMLVMNNNKFTDKYIQDHPRYLEAYIPFRQKFPELETDTNNIHYKKLFDSFTATYAPDMSNHTAKLFPITGKN